MRTRMSSFGARLHVRGMMMVVGAVVATAPDVVAQSRHRADSGMVKRAPECRDLASFYASLPAIEPRPFDKTPALQLATMPLSCMDHPQPRPNAAPYLW